MARGTRHDQVAHAGQAHAGHSLSAASMDQTTHLSQSTGHDERKGVVAHARSGCDAADDGHDVLHRTAKLNTDQIGREVDAEVRSEDDALEEIADLHALTSDGRGGEGPMADLLGVIGA